MAYNQQQQPNDSPAYFQDFQQYASQSNPTMYSPHQSSHQPRHQVVVPLQHPQSLPQYYPQAVQDPRAQIGIAQLHPNQQFHHQQPPPPPHSVPAAYQYHQPYQQFQQPQYDQVMQYQQPNGYYPQQMQQSQHIQQSQATQQRQSVQQGQPVQQGHFVQQGQPAQQNQPIPQSQHIEQSRSMPQNQPVLQQHQTMQQSQPISRGQPTQNIPNRAPTAPPPTPPPTQQQQPRVATQATAQTNGSMVAPPAETRDYAKILLHLADEYLSTARTTDNDSEEYFKLIATGLGCLETVLINLDLPALQKAQVSLAYATVLYDETENYDDAERVLSKAIELCERNKYIDLKYQMQLLLARVLYESKPKAAVRNLQNVIQEVEAWKHVAWEYALRFQLAMFYLSSPSVRDTHAGIQQMDRISTLAGRHNDRAVVAFAAIVEAMLHLMTAASDAVSSAQQALAKARALQLDPEVANVPQLEFTVEVIDLCCSLRESNHQQGDPKRKKLEEVFSKVSEDKQWLQNGNKFFLPLTESSLSGVRTQDGGLVSKQNGKYGLTFSWFDLVDTATVAYLLCAVSRAHKNNIDSKSEQFIEEGLRVLQEGSDRTAPENRRGQSKLTSGARNLMKCRFITERAFLYCANGRYDAARAEVDHALAIADELGSDCPKSTRLVIQYLRGVIDQGTGHLDDALNTYLSSFFNLAQFQKPTSQPSQPVQQHRLQDLELDTVRNIALLANMNALLIISTPSHPQHHLTAHLIEQLEQLIGTSQNQNVTASFTLIRSLVTNSGILRSKNLLMAALNTAKVISNTQISALVLMTMQQQFFRGQIDEHAIKCVKATAMQTKNWGNPMWRAVVSDMEAEAFEFQGKLDEADLKRREAQDRMQHLPEQIRMVAGSR